jgi:hypothetical protein
VRKETLCIQLFGNVAMVGTLLAIVIGQRVNLLGNRPERQRWSGSVQQRGKTSSACTWLSLRVLTFLPVEVLTLRGLVTYYVLFFIHLQSRKVEVSGITPHPNEQ